MSSFKILFILLLAFIAFSVETDVYVPCFPDMVRDLGISETSIQKILSINFLGICLSCLFSGPLSDSFGRKKILSMGTGMFVLASLVCYLSNQFEWILIGRFLQGVGAGTILAVACTCIFDLYEPAKSGQLVAIVNAVISVMMAFAPIVGVWLNASFGWKSCFLFILILASASWIGITFFLPETHPIGKRKKFNLYEISKGYVDLIQSRKFMLGSFVWSLMFAAVIVYTANVSLLFIVHLKVSESYFGFFQCVTMGSFAVSSLACSYLIGKLGDQFVKRLGTVLFFSGILGLQGINFFAPTSPILISLAMALVSGGTSLAMIVYFTDSMIGIQNVGAALSLVQGLRLFLVSQSTDLSRVLFDGSLNSIVQVLGGMGIIIFICILFLPKIQHDPNRAEVQAVL